MKNVSIIVIVYVLVVFFAFITGLLPYLGLTIEYLSPIILLIGLIYFFNFFQNWKPYSFLLSSIISFIYTISFYNRLHSGCAGDLCGIDGVFWVFLFIILMLAGVIKTSAHLFSSGKKTTARYFIYLLVISLVLFFSWSMVRFVV